MNDEQLEWLPLSKPPARPSKERAPAGTAPCPECGWPTAPGAKACHHCGRSLSGEPASDVLAELNLDLPPRLIQFISAPPHWFDESAIDSPAIYDLRLRAERFRVTTGFDRLICLDDISVDHYQHQMEAALHALRDMHGRALLADEVGLGKTIEAGIVMKELIERGLVSSVLILVPASLTWQWREEMETKFHETFVVVEELDQAPGAGPDDRPAEAETGPAPPGRWIISLDRAKSGEWAERLLGYEYDLLIVDEAHKLKNHRTLAYRFVNGIRKRYVLMLTATPVHNDLMELYNLITILRPGHLGTRRAFRQNFVAGAGGRRRIVVWSTDVPNGITSYVNSAKPGYFRSYGFEVNKPNGGFSFDHLVAPPLSADPKKDWARQASPEDLEKFALARRQVAQLLQRGYRVDRAWLVCHKKGGLYGFRLELSDPSQEEEAAGSDSASSRRLPGRRTVYSSDQGPHNYLAKSYEARQAYRQDKVKSRWILKRLEDFSQLESLSLASQDQKAVNEVNQLLGQGYEVVDFEAVEHEQAGFLRKQRRTDFVCRLKLKPNASRSHRQGRSRRTTPRNASALRGLLQEVMIRNRRHSVGIRFPARRAAVDHLNLTPPERQLYDGVTAYIRTRLQQVRAAGDRQGLGALRMTLLTLQKELCSSPQAVARTLEKMVEREADPQLAQYLALAQSIKYGRKVDATRLILEQYPGKFLIFTDYLPTLHALQAALEEAGYEVVLFHGGMPVHERVEAVRAFRRSARVMISTQSGGEGHNLQFCHQMINYDLPWNPMRIEQRIGRLQRLGQKHEVAIFNLSATNTIEAYVLDLLARKIRMFELVIGELDLILGQFDEQRGFEDYITEAWAGSRSEAELLAMLAELDALLDKSQAVYEEVHEASDELSDLIDAYDEVIR